MMGMLLRLMVYAIAHLVNNIIICFSVTLSQFRIIIEIELDSTHVCYTHCLVPRTCKTIGINFV